MTTKAEEVKEESKAMFEEKKGGDKKQTVVNNIVDGDKLKELFNNALKNFKAKNKVLPDCIVVFRDGVGESQRKKVIESEIT
jgi:hypothetical protein